MSDCSTGGIIALGLGAERWSVQKSVENFLRLCDKAFSAHRTGPLALLHHGGRYRTTALADSLRSCFSDQYIFGGRQDSNVYTNKVAVTATSGTWDKAVVFANYNHDLDEDAHYVFERPEVPEWELKFWEVARATSAAPTVSSSKVAHWILRTDWTNNNVIVFQAIGQLADSRTIRGWRHL